MARELAPLDISNAPELLKLAEEVCRTGRPRTLRRGSEALATLMPAAAPRRRRTPRMIGDAIAIVERTAGIFREYAKTPPPTPREEKDAFEQAVAEQVMESMGG